MQYTKFPYIVLGDESTKTLTLTCRRFYIVRSEHWKLNSLVVRLVDMTVRLPDPSYQVDGNCQCESKARQ